MSSILDPKQVLRRYIEKYDGGASSFFGILANVLDELGTEWNDFGKKNWGAAFKESAVHIRNVAEHLDAMQVEYDAENTSASDVVDMLEDYKRKSKSLFKRLFDV